ncbi:MAG: hypothetical protein Q7Q71_09540 [Verrucomicrobiota bacterium JB023]|nr:hypothetical protein [Verrucomicrobiota bacterium JB023]
MKLLLLMSFCGILCSIVVTRENAAKASAYESSELVEKPQEEKETLQ